MAARVISVSQSDIMALSCVMLPDGAASNYRQASGVTTLERQPARGAPSRQSPARLFLPFTACVLSAYTYARRPPRRGTPLFCAPAFWIPWLLVILVMLRTRWGRRLLLKNRWMRLKFWWSAGGPVVRRASSSVWHEGAISYCIFRRCAGRFLATVRTAPGATMASGSVIPMVLAVSLALRSRHHPVTVAPWSSGTIESHSLVGCRLQSLPVAIFLTIGLLAVLNSRAHFCFPRGYRGMPVVLLVGASHGGIRGGIRLGHPALSSVRTTTRPLTRWRSPGVYRLRDWRSAQENLRCPQDCPRRIAGVCPPAGWHWISQRSPALES